MKILLTTLNSKYIHINLAIRQLHQLNKEYEGFCPNRTCLPPLGKIKRAIFRHPLIIMMFYI